MSDKIYVMSEGHVTARPASKYKEIYESLRDYPTVSYKYDHNNIYSTEEAAKHAARQWLEREIADLQATLK
jgi:hypothetical protein